MVRQKSGGIGGDMNNSSSSPTPSIDSLNGATVGSLCGDNHSSSSSSSDHSGESGLGGHSLVSATLSNGTGGMLMMSSSSASSSGLGSSPQLRGVSALISDFGVSGLLEGSGMDFGGSSYCVGCKGREPVARCRGCAGFLCPSCVMGHQCLHCFDGHSLSDLGRCGGDMLPELDSIHHLVQDSKAKAADLRGSLKGLEGSAGRLNLQLAKAQNDVNETFQFFTSMLEERKSEVMRELEHAYAGRQMAMSVYGQKAQETVEKIYQTTDFIERLLKRASSGEVLLLKRPIELRYAALLSAYHDAAAAHSAAAGSSGSQDSPADLDFVQPSFAAVQNGIKTHFGYVRTRDSNNVISSSNTNKQPPISRPTASSSSSSMLNNNSLGLMTSGSNGGGLGGSMAASFGLNGLLDRQQQQKQLQTPPAAGGYNLGHLALSSEPMEGGSLLSKRFIRGPSGLMDMSAPSSSAISSNPYEKWSNGSDSKSMFMGDSSSSSSSQQQQQHHMSSLSSQSNMSNGSNGSSDSILDLSSKLLSAPIFPPKSQIKRQKMIYHCKFGEFGVLEGQFTEPSGVAVNAQNDIIVADTNNHRIQIFDKEGRFKFQFGECGKRDGQLLYPNRVAVVRQSGDIVVTERSPTHQVQIYNQYGQFVRKFGANILQHPRGVCVDHKGRIVVVECKVMRVIIFDQMGNVLNKFGCSKHLEFPNGVVVNDRQEIFISDNRAHCVKVFNYEGTYLRQIGGEGITNYPIGVGINAAGEVTIADNHNNFNLSVFSQEGQLLSALESKVKHAQCFDVSLMDDGSVVLASKDYRLYIYRYVQVPPIGM